MALDAVSTARLQSVSPSLAAKIVQLAVMLADEGIVFRVTQGLRTWAEQDALYAQGRTAPGSIVTNAKGGQSWHNYGVAVDVVPMDQEPPQPDWNVQHPVWQRLITVGESLGLYSGSEFVCLKDWPHFQVTGRFPIGAPDAEAQQVYENEGTAAFWAEVDNS
jgi:peptidoglycan L-alanyl-D-glutamate endopeptidase CwlK